MGEYYANPHNHFWAVLGYVIGDHRFASLDYSSRCDVLKSRGIAVWDICEQFTRYRSADATLTCEGKKNGSRKLSCFYMCRTARSTTQPHAYTSSFLSEYSDIARLLVANPTIQRILCNGSASFNNVRKYKLEEKMRVNRHCVNFKATILV